MSSLYADPRKHPGTSAAEILTMGLVQTGAAPDDSIKKPEIMSRLGRTDYALDDLKCALNALDDRLNAAMTPADIEEKDASPSVTAETLIGKRIELQEEYVRMAVSRIQDMLQRLEI